MTGRRGRRVLGSMVAPAAILDDLAAAFGVDPAHS
jgi:hypothetical protein